MGTSDDSFRAEGPGLFGFLTESDDDNVPVKAFGTVGYAPNVGVLEFSEVAADPEGPIQQNSYSQRAGVEGGSVDFTGTAGVSLNHVGVYGQVEDQPPFRPVSAPASSARRARSRASSGSRATATAS